MPITICEIGGGLGGSFVYEGRIKEQDERAGQQLLTSEPKYRMWMFLLADATAVESVHFQVDEVAGIAQRSHRLLQLTRAGFVMAVVAPSNHVFGQGRMWQAFSEPLPREARLFRTQDEADHWIREKVRTNFGFEISSPIKDLPAARLATTARRD